MSEGPLELALRVVRTLDELGIPYVLGDGMLDQRQLERRVRIQVTEDPPRHLWIGSAEDQVLRELTWYRAGGEVSDRQWRDVVGILAVQSGRIDMAELGAAAAELGLDALLERAINEASEGA